MREVKGRTNIGSCFREYLIETKYVLDNVEYIKKRKNRKKQKNQKLSYEGKLKKQNLKLHR
jgi:hypothetical protein